MSETLETLLTPMTLVRSTDRATLQRAQPYAEGDAITWLTAEPQRLEARVQGSRPQPYVVEFAVRNDELSRRCNCPMGNEGGFCKHLAAVALAWLAGRAAAGLTEGELPAIRRHLQSLPAAELVELLMQHAVEDQTLRARLLRAAQRYGSADPDLSRWRQALHQAVEAFCEYPDHWDSDGNDDSEALCELADALTQRFDCGGEVPAALVEEAIDEFAACTEHAGEMAGGELSDRIDALAELHMRIYRRTPPGPAALAAHLIELEVEDEHGIWRHTARHYAETLGATGLAEHRRLAAQALEDERAKPDTGNDGMYRVMRDILIDHAQLAGDLDTEIALLAERPDGSTTWLYIAERLQAAGRSDEALAWAERGLVADAGHLVDWRLRAFLIERYVERNRGADALALAWSAFDRVPDLSGYQTLHGLAVRFGVLDDWRSRALARMGAMKPVWPGGDGATGEGPEQTLRVEALCWEGEFDAAWAAAGAGRCSNSALEKLADASSASHPAEAAAVYQQLVSHCVEQTHNFAYTEAIRRLHKLRPLLDAEAFAGYVAGLRTRYRLKRNFIRMLAEF